MIQDKKTVTVNGRRYDAATGAAINNVAHNLAPERKYADIKKPPHAKFVHSAVQRSKTLHRRVVKKPKNATSVAAKKIGHNMDIARNKLVARFAPTTEANQSKLKQQNKVARDIGPVRHPMVVKAELATKNNSKNDSPVPKNAKDTKDAAISRALQQSKPSSKLKRKLFAKLKPFVNVFSVGFVLIAIGVVIAYANLPSLSVRVAGTQAGINATYPGYKPDGYRFKGPASYGNNEVTLKFTSNSSDQYFTIKQTKSSWDSSAVKDYAQEMFGDEFITIRQSGRTIYTQGGSATWVNAGILYTIDGEPSLSPNQIRRIAISL